MSIGQNHGKFFKGAVVKNDGKFGKALDVNGSDIAVQISSLAKILKKFLKGPILYLIGCMCEKGAIILAFG